MPTIDDLLRRADCDLSDPIDLCQRGNFRWGPCQARLYDPRESMWTQPFLYTLYEKTRLSGTRHPQPLDLEKRIGLGPLPALFCGMTNLGPDAICSYLAQRALCIVGEWRKEVILDGRANPDGTHDPGYVREGFSPLGYCFPSTSPLVSEQSKTGIPSNSMFAGYTIFSEAWRTPQQTVLMWLGLAWLFHTFQLAALHGSRYATNHLTRRWTRQFGFEDCGTLPYCMAGEPGGPLVEGVFSTLLRVEFERRLREVLARARELTASAAAPLIDVPQ